MLFVIFMLFLCYFYVISFFFPGGSDGKESTCNAENLGSIPELGRSPQGEGMATLSSILAWRIPIDRGAWRVTVHGVTESDITE